MVLALAAVLLLIGSATGFVWHGRTQRLDQAAGLAEQQANRLANDLMQTLALAKLATAQTDAHLRALPPTSSLGDGLGALATQRAELLAALPLPFALHALAADGREIELTAAPSGHPGHRATYPVPAGLPDRWTVGSTQGPSGARELPLLRPAAPNAWGVAAYAVALTHRALQVRFESDRLPRGGSVVLHRVEADGSATVLARAPLVEEQINRRVRGPLMQALARAPSGVFAAPGHLDGVHRIVAYRRLDGDAAALVLAYGVATDEVLAGWHAMVPGIAAIALLLAAGMAFGGWRLEASLQAMANSRRALARSELHFRALADNLPDVVVRMDRQGRHLYANAAIERATGLPPAAFIGKTNTDLGMPADNVARWMACLRQVFDTGQAQRLEFGFPGPHGDTHWESQVVLEQTGDGGAPAALVISRDISERRRADDALRASEQMLRHFFESDLVGMAITEPDQHWGQFNQRLCQILGYSSEQMQQQTWAQITHPDDLAADLAQFERLLRGESESYRMDKRFIRGDGTVIDAAIAVRCQRDAAGKPVRFYAIVEDIGARKQVEARLARQRDDLEQEVQQRTAELAHSEARLRTIFETVPVAIGEEDWSGVQVLLRGLRARGVVDGPGYFAAHPDFVQQCLRAVKVLRLNQKALSLHDARDQRRDLPDLQAIYPTREALPQFVGELEALWAGRRQYTSKKSLPSVTGRPLNLMLTMSLPGLDDADGTALVCLVDITEIDRLNAELDRSVTQLRQANQELETFTYSVSHDLKAPLRGIDGYSRLLLSDHQDRLDDEGRAFLGHIRQATQHMGVLIDDLLTYSRLERRDLTVNPLPLAALVDSALVGFQPDLAARGVRLDLHIPPDLRARGDAQGLTMSVRNLLDNALKFSAARQPPHITITGTRTEDGVLLAIQDNGLGFDMKFHDRIFAIFQRLHRTEDYPGTGVGLAIVRKAMERMGGRVWAVSQPGQGATFTLQLPEA